MKPTLIKQMDGDKFDVSNYVKHDYVCLAPAVHSMILEDINKYSRGKHLISLGCADGAFERKVDCAGFTGVDPFSESEGILKRDGLEYLKEQEDNSVDVVMAKMSVHFLDLEDVKRTLQQKFKRGGTALFYNICAGKSKVFGN